MDKRIYPRTIDLSTIPVERQRLAKSANKLIEFCRRPRSSRFYSAEEVSEAARQHGLVIAAFGAAGSMTKAVRLLRRNHLPVSVLQFRQLFSSTLLYPYDDPIVADHKYMCLYDHVNRIYAARLRQGCIAAWPNWSSEAVDRVRRECSQKVISVSYERLAKLSSNSRSSKDIEAFCAIPDSELSEHINAHLPLEVLRVESMSTAKCLSRAQLARRIGQSCGVEFKPKEICRLLRRIRPDFAILENLRRETSVIAQLRRLEKKLNKAETSRLKPKSAVIELHSVHSSEEARLRIQQRAVRRRQRYEIQFLALE